MTQILLLVIIFKLDWQLGLAAIGLIGLDYLWWEHRIKKKHGDINKIIKKAIQEIEGSGKEVIKE